MYYEKSEVVKMEIIEGLDEDVNKEHSVFILFCIFIGYFIKSVCNLFKVFFKGLWCFIKYGYYRIMAWCDGIGSEEARER